MSNYNNVIRPHPIQQPNNDLKDNNKRKYSNNQNNGKQAGLTYEQLAELRRRMAHIEAELKKLENNTKPKVVVAPLKKDIEDEYSRNNTRNIKSIPAKSKEVQTYKGPAPQIMARISASPNKVITRPAYEKAIETYKSSAAQTIISKPKKFEQTEKAIAEVKEKPSLWQRIKRAVKAFFDDEPEKKSDYIEEFNTNTWRNNNNKDNTYSKYNQFRQSVPKTTLQIDSKKKTNTENKPKEHILDRYV